MESAAPLSPGNPGGTGLLSSALAKTTNDTISLKGYWSSILWRSGLLGFGNRDVNTFSENFCVLAFQSHVDSSNRIASSIRTDISISSVAISSSPGLFSPSS